MRRGFMFLSCCVALVWLCEGWVAAEEMRTRVFQVPRDFVTVESFPRTEGMPVDPFAATETSAKKTGESVALIKTARDHLEAAGVLFPAGASASFDPFSSTVTVVNTEGNLDLCESYVDSVFDLRPHHVSFVLTVVEGPGELIRQANEAAAGEEDAGKALVGLMQEAAKVKPQVRVVREAFLETKSGSRASTRSVKEHFYPAISGDDPGRLAVNREMQRVGMNLEIMPVIGGDGQHIHLTYSLDLHPTPPSERQVEVSDPATADAAEIPLMQVSRLHFAAETQVISGGTRLLGIARPYGKAGAESEDVLWASFLTTHVVTLDSLPRVRPKVVAAEMKVPSGMKKLAYPLPPGLLDVVLDPWLTLQQYFEGHGVAPAAGANAVVEGDVLTAVNTHENLERIVVLVEHLTAKLPRTAVVTLHTVKGNGDFLRGLASEAAVQKDHAGQWAQVQAALKAGSHELKAVNSSRLETKSEVRASLVSVQEHQCLAEYGKDEKERVGPRFEIRPVGSSLEFEPRITEDGAVELTISHRFHPLPPEQRRGMVREPGAKEKQNFPLESLPVQETVTELHVQSGGTRLLSLLRPPGDGAEDQLLATFIQCEAVVQSSHRRDKGPSLAQMLAGVPKSDSQEQFTRSFRVPPDFLSESFGQPSLDDAFSVSTTPTPRKSVKQILEEAGIPFPPEASVHVGGATSQILVRNTSENLDKVEQFVKWMERVHRREAVAMTSQVLEAPGPLLRELMAGLGSRGNHRPELEKLLAAVKEGAVKHVGLSRIETRVGCRGNAEQGVEQVFFTGVLEEDIRLVGFRTEVEVSQSNPYAAPGFQMATEFHPAGPLEHREYVIDSQGRRLEFPLTDFYVMKLSATTFIPDGNARMLAVWKPVGKAEWEKGDVLQVLFVSCDEVLTRE